MGSMGTWRAAAAGVIAAGLMAGVVPGSQADNRLEPPPTLPASELAPAELLKGARFTVDEEVPADLVARFTIRSDFGTMPANGVGMLGVRVAEVAALEQLEKTSKTEEFVKAAGSAAKRPVGAAIHIVTNPVETAVGAPAAVGRFLDRVQLGVAKVGEAASAPGKSSEDKAADVSKRVGGITADAFGYEQERRALAKRVGVDPYTTNPVLAHKLDEIAWVSFSGRLGTNLAVSVVVPYSIALTATSVTQDLVWDTKPADLLRMNATKLTALGASPAQADALMKNPWFSLSMLTALVNGLDQLRGVSGRPQVVAFAAAAKTEVEARLVTESVEMLRRHHAKVPIARVSAPGPVVAHTKAGTLLVAAPFDYVAWTEHVSRFAQRPDLKAKQRVAWLSGRFSPRAREALTAAGWTLREGV